MICRRLEYGRKLFCRVLQRNMAGSCSVVFYSGIWQEVVLSCFTAEYGRKLFCRVLQRNMSGSCSVVSYSGIQGDVKKAAVIFQFNLIFNDVLLNSDRRQTPIVVGKRKTGAYL
jgi:hypothetical protein